MTCKAFRLWNTGVKDTILTLLTSTTWARFIATNDSVKSHIRLHFAQYDTTSCRKKIQNRMIFKDPEEDIQQGKIESGRRSQTLAISYTCVVGFRVIRETKIYNANLRR